MNNKSVFITLFLIPMILLGCGRMNNEEIKQSWWKYGEGFHIGDALRLDDDELKMDTIFSNNKPVAIIISCKKRFPQNDAVMKIQSLETGEKGTYFEKGLR